jgi:hypothetical protein
MKHSLKFGAIAGLVMVSSWWIGQLFFAPEPGQPIDMSKTEILGYITMFLALIAVFVGVKDARDKTGDDAYTFGTAFKLGLNIVFVASLIYVIGWMIYYPNFMPDFMDQYAAAQMQSYQEAGLSEAEIMIKQQEMDTWVEMYENPFIMAGLTFMEFFPIGLAGALLSAAILRRKSE